MIYAEHVSALLGDPNNMEQVAKAMTKPVVNSKVDAQDKSTPAERQQESAKSGESAESGESAGNETVEDFKLLKSGAKLKACVVDDGVTKKTGVADEVKTVVHSAEADNITDEDPFDVLPFIVGSPADGKSRPLYPWGSKVSNPLIQYRRFIG